MSGSEFQLTPTSGLISGQATVGVAAVRILGSSQALTRSVSIKSAAANTGIVYIGKQGVTTADGYGLGAGESLNLDLNDQDTPIYAIASAAAQTVYYLAVS